MAIESACIPFPSEIIMPLAGWLLVKDKGHGEEYLFLAAFYGALGNMIGSLVAYYAGAWGGRPLLVKYGRYVLITHKELDWADRWFGKYGEATAFVSRLVPVIRTFISFPAGIARMRVSRFALFSFAGAYPWCLALAWGGYLLGDNWETIKSDFQFVTIPIAIAIVVTLGFLLFRRVREVMRAGSVDRFLAEQDEPPIHESASGRATRPRPDAE